MRIVVRSGKFPELIGFRDKWRKGIKIMEEFKT